MGSDDGPLIRGACSSDISVPTLWGEIRPPEVMLFQHKPLSCLFGIIWPEIYFFMPSYWELVGTVSIKWAMRIVVQLLRHVQLFATPQTAAHQAPLSSTISQCLLNSCPLSQWSYLTISASATPFSFRPQAFLASGSFPVSWLFVSGGQSIGASASEPVLPMNIQAYFL